MVPLRVVRENGCLQTIEPAAFVFSVNSCACAELLFVTLRVKHAPSGAELPLSLPPLSELPLSLSLSPDPTSPATASSNPAGKRRLAGGLLRWRCGAVSG